MREQKGYPTQSKLLSLLIKETGQMAQLDMGDLFNASIKELIEQVDAADKEDFEFTPLSGRDEVSVIIKLRESERIAFEDKTRWK